MRLDGTGKVSLDHIYTRSDPRPYFTTLRTMDYRIPQLAAPYFRALIEQYRQVHPGRTPTVLDLGSSYGINAALLRCGMTMDELYECYGDGTTSDWTRQQLLSRDRELVLSRDGERLARFVGLDSSQPALDYARAAGFLDDAVHADLEDCEPSDHQREQLRKVDVVISTGCIGYVTAKTLIRLVTVPGGRRPWMAHFVLRMFPFEPIAACLADVGYRCEPVEGMFRQRRFASAREQARVLETLSEAGVNPQGLESEGWLYAQLHVCRPVEAAGAFTLDAASAPAVASASASASAGT